MSSFGRSVADRFFTGKETTGAPLPKVLRLYLLALFIFSLQAYLVPEPAVAADSISISCYRGSEYEGNIEILQVRGAANACNQVYSSCEGQCSACFIDYDYVAEVCVDIYGRTYLR